MVGKLSVPIDISDPVVLRRFLIEAFDTIATKKKLQEAIERINSLEEKIAKLNQI